MSEAINTAGNKAGCGAPAPWFRHVRSKAGLDFRLAGIGQFACHRLELAGQPPASIRPVSPIARSRYSHRMISDRDIWMAANMLMRRHGEDAGFRAAQRADELFAKGDFEGHRTFLRIVRRIERLAATTPDGTVH